MGGPARFGFSRRLRCVTQVCLPEPQAGATRVPSQLKPHRWCRRREGLSPLSPHSSGRDLGQPGRDWTSVLWPSTERQSHGVGQRAPREQLPP